MYASWRPWSSSPARLDEDSLSGVGCEVPLLRTADLVDRALAYLPLNNEAKDRAKIMLIAFHACTSLLAKPPLVCWYREQVPDCSLGAWGAVRCPP